jgi:hypothetical protein
MLEGKKPNISSAFWFMPGRVQIKVTKGINKRKRNGFYGKNKKVFFLFV